MKQQILNALKAKFVGVSDAILDRVAAKLAQTVTTAEQVQTAVDGVTFQQVLESYGDSRATQAQQTAVHNYEQKYGLKDGVKVTPPETQPPVVPPVIPPVTPPATQQQGGAEAVPAWAQAIIESTNSLKNEWAQMKNLRTTETRKQQISTLIEKLPENLRKAYSRTPVDGLTDEQFTALVGEITTEVGDIQSTIQQKGAVFGKPAAQNGGNQGAELTNEQIAAISRRDGAASGQGQPF